MTDKESLEFAAKAAGELTPEWYGNNSYFDGVLKRWNPLHDDGDALRLAVRLHLTIISTEYIVSVSEPGCRSSMELTGDDPCAATRRAIVRAAAEIGKRMPND